MRPCDSVKRLLFAVRRSLSLEIFIGTTDRPTEPKERKIEEKKDLKQKKGMNDLYSEFLFMTYGLTQHRTESNRIE